MSAPDHRAASGSQPAWAWPRSQAWRSGDLFTCTIWSSRTSCRISRRSRRDRWPDSSRIDPDRVFGNGSVPPRHAQLPFSTRLGTIDNSSSLMTKRSAGILLYRRSSSGPEVFLIHPGGPFWAKKDAWSIPKGEYHDGEPALEAARPEFQEETGSRLALDLSADKFKPLGVIRQPAGKEVTGWAVEGDFDP